MIYVYHVMYIYLLGEVWYWRDDYKMALYYNFLSHTLQSWTS